MREITIREPEREAALRLADRHFGDDYYNRPRLKRFVSHFPTDGTILDFGCHDGVFLNLLRRHGRRGLGIDYDLKQVQHCRGFGLEAMRADIFEFARDPENEGKYAGIMMSDFVEHFDPRPLQELLDQSVRILRPGGVLAIITPNSRSLLMCSGGFYENEIEHHHTYSISGIRSFLERRGMKTVSSGVNPESRTRILSPRPLQLLRNLAFFGLGLVLCGKDCLYQDSHLVMQRAV